MDPSRGGQQQQESHHNDDLEAFHNEHYNGGHSAVLAVEGPTTATTNENGAVTSSTSREPHHQPYSSLNSLSKLTAQDDIEDLISTSKQEETVTTSASPCGSLRLDEEPDHRHDQELELSTIIKRTVPRRTCDERSRFSSFSHSSTSLARTGDLVLNSTAPKKKKLKASTAKSGTAKTEKKESFPATRDGDDYHHPELHKNNKMPTSAGVVLSRRFVILLTIFATVGFVSGMTSLLTAIAAFLPNRNNDQDTARTKNIFDHNNSATYNVNASLLDTIYARGYVRCGLVTLQPGFFFDSGNRDPQTDEPIYVGFDVDLCKALAAALFGDAEAYHTHRFDRLERWTKLSYNEVDLIFRSRHSMERDVYIEEIGTGLQFSSPYFYDGLGFGGLGEFVECAETFHTNDTCADLRICVPTGTTIEAVIGEKFPAENIVPVVSSADSFPTECNVIAGEKNQVNKRTLELQGYRGEYVEGQTFFSHSPISLVTKEGDPTWTDFVEAVVQSLVYAEEENIFQVTADKMPITDLFGDRFESMFKNALAASGNYGEIYNRNLENFLPRSGLNRLNRLDPKTLTGAPAMMSLPFGDLQAKGPAIEDLSPTIQAIKERGHLRCAKVDLEGFSTFDKAQKDFSGFDIDMCRAISAALFDGMEHFLLVDTVYAERWKLIQEKRVDILAFANTWTIEKDVKETSTGIGYTFTDAYMHLWFGFGGSPEYIECADNVDVVSPECQGLRICALEGTFSFKSLKARLGSDFYLFPAIDQEATLDDLRNGQCNVMFGSSISLAAARDTFHREGLPFTVGTNGLKLEPLGLVTRQDDPVWSDFVRWILWSLIYAEEQGITQATAHRMPRPEIFGPFRTKSFYHAVNSVGNYGEVYERNLGGLLPRAGRNELNDSYQPRIYAVSGFGQGFYRTL